MKLYSLQTADEQVAESTEIQNGVGFTSTDAKFLSSIYSQYATRKSLSDRQLSCLFRTLPKYAGQLVKVCLSSGTLVKTSEGYKILRRPLWQK